MHKYTNIHSYIKIKTYTDISTHINKQNKKAHKEIDGNKLTGINKKLTETHTSLNTYVH